MEINTNNGNIHFTKSDLNKLEKNYKRNLINSLSGYKSTNLIGTIDQNEKINLAIFNTIIHVGSNPPLMGFLIRPPVVPRHTLKYIYESKCFTINHITRSFYNKAHQTAARYWYDDKSEFDMVGLTPFFSENIKAPYVKESPVKIGLEFKEEHKIQSNGTIFIVGEIVEVMAPKSSVLTDGMVDLGITATLTSSGLDTYYNTSKIARLSHANRDQDLEIIG